MRRIALLSLLLTVTLSTGSAEPLPQSWQRAEMNDPLHRVSFDEFVLVGKYLVPPHLAAAGSTAPRLVVHCSAGKFLDGYIDVGAVVNTVVIEKTTILAGTTFPPVVLTEFRLDDRKIQTESWSPSTAGTAPFFPYTTLNNLLYGHVLPHKEGKGDHVQRVVIGINEAFASEVMMQFDMPDASQIGQTCGVIYRSKR
jgi:hypothetical protein